MIGKINSLLEKRSGAGQGLAQRMSRPHLTDRELECALYLATGAPDKIIAADLRLGPGTVRSYLENLFLKCGVRGRGEFASWAHHNHLGRMAALRLAGRK